MNANKMANACAQTIHVTCECAPNIALIKYWGKANEDLILPMNSSISVTLDRNVLCTTTSVMLMKKSNIGDKTRIRFWFGKTLQEFDEDGNLLATSVDTSGFISTRRFVKMLKKIKENCSIPSPHAYNIHICTKNSFPHACGMASSASGYACLAMSMAHAYKYGGTVCIVRVTYPYKDIFNNNNH